MTWQITSVSQNRNPANFDSCYFCECQIQNTRYKKGKFVILLVTFPPLIGRPTAVLHNHSVPRTILQGVSRIVSKVIHPFFRTYFDESGCPFTCWTSNGVGLNFWKKILNFLLVMVRPRYRPSLVFRLSLVCSKFKFSAGIQLFGMKITSYGKPYLKNSFPRSDLST